MPTMESTRITAFCCALPNKNPAQAATTTLRRHESRVKCSTCGTEFAVDHNKGDFGRIADFEARLFVAAQKAVDNSQGKPLHGGPYINLSEV
jgi:hypothetical protein